MVGLGILMLITTLVANVQRWRGKLIRSRRLLWWLVWMSPGGFIAMLAGWLVTELGRQPWTVYGLLRTAQSVSALPLGWMLASVIGVLLIYSLSFALGLRYLLQHVNSPLPQEPHIVANMLTTSSR